MKMSASYPNNVDVRLTYNIRAQAVMLQACEQIDNVFSDLSIRSALEDQTDDFRERVKIGQDQLRDLAQTKVREIRLSRKDLQAAFVSVMFAASYRVIMDQPLASLPEAVMLLAKVTPLELPILPLPPAAEVFCQRDVPPDVWECFEKIRLWREVEPPLISVIEIYHLWFALRRIKTPQGPLLILTRYLHQVTEMFRCTMGELAEADLSANRSKQGRKARQQKRSQS
jgi:hypothetical protein